MSKRKVKYVRDGVVLGYYSGYDWELNRPEGAEIVDLGSEGIPVPPPPPVIEQLPASDSEGEVVPESSEGV